jgi:hypothetical protein
MTRIFASLLPYIIAGLFILALLLFLLSLQQLRRGRTGPYWRLRRAAGQRGGQLFLLSIALFGIAAALALFSGLADLAYRRLTGRLNADPDTPVGVVLPTFTQVRLFTPDITETAADSATSTPKNTSTATRPPESPAPSSTAAPSLTFTLTPTPTVTFTPSTTFESVLALTPQPSERQLRAGAAIEITAASGDISPNQDPTSPAKQFAAGIQRVYFFFDYRRMDDGIGWSRILYRDGVAIQGQNYLWSLGESGASYFFFGNDEGYPPGEYEVRLFLGEQPINQFTFSIVPA